MASLLVDGFQTLITFQGASGMNGITFKEREVTPPDLDMGGAIDTVTMRNTPGSARTKRPKSLYSVGNIKAMVQYNPFIMSQLIGTGAGPVFGTTGILGSPQNILVTFPDGTTETAYGWLEKFAPQAHKEGVFPEAEIEICIGNQNANGTYAAPTWPAS